MSRKTKLTAELINQHLTDADSSLRLVGEYKTLKHHTEFMCANGHIRTARPGDVMGGMGCAVCNNCAPLSTEEVNRRLSDRQIKLVSGYVNTRTKSEFVCTSGHHWTTFVSAVLRGNGCPHCSGMFPWTKDVVNEKIKGTGITLMNDFKNIKTKTTFMCNKGHQWDTNVHHVLAGRGCPVCCDFGFKTDMPAYAYLLDFGDFIKYGITNNLERRLTEHKNNGHYTVIAKRMYENGSDAASWERNIKRRFGGRYVSKERCPDGYTETLSLSLLEQLEKTLNITEA